MELRSKPEVKALCERKLGNLWKNVRHPVFRHFLSWRMSVEETKKRERDHQMAKAHHDQKVYVECLKKWADLYYQELTLIRAATHRQQALIKMALSEWTSVRKSSQQMQLLMTKAEQFRNTHLLKQEVVLWIERTRRGKRLKGKELA